MVPPSSATPQRGRTARQAEQAERSHHRAGGALAELRHVEAELETVRQAHYAANDSLHQAQGRWPRRRLKSRRLEERIRYAVDGRAARRAAHGPGTDAERAVGRPPRQAEERSWRPSPRTAERRRRGGRGCWPRRPRSRPGGRARAGRRVARAPRRRPNEQRARWGRCSSRSRCWRPTAATSTSSRASCAAGASAWRPRSPAWRRRTMAPLADLRAARLPQADERLAEADARLHELQEQVPQLDDERRQRSRRWHAESAKQAGYRGPPGGAEAPAGEGADRTTLKPWLAAHGLDRRLAGPVDAVHIETGWEPRSRGGAARAPERAGGRPHRPVRARFARSAAGRLAFYTLPQRRSPSTHQHAAAPVRPAAPGLRRQAFERRCSTTGSKASTPPPTWTRRWRSAPQLTHGEVIMTRDGHAVSPVRGDLLRARPEQAGMLARAQEIENLSARRGQALIADDARTALVRLDAAYTDAVQRAWPACGASRQIADHARTSCRSSCCSLSSRPRRPACAAAARPGAGRDDAQLSALDERRATGEARFEELDLQLADTQERHAELDDAVIAAERRLADAREQLRAPERQARRRNSRRARWRRVAASCSARSRPRSSQMASNARPASSWSWSWARLRRRRAGRPADALAPLKLEREQALARATQRVRRPVRQAAPPPTSSAWVRAQPGPAARAHHRAAARAAGRAAGRRAVPEQLQRRPT